MTSAETKPWAVCTCGCDAPDHQTVVLRPLAVDPGNRVLFEGTLGACSNCDCWMYNNLRQAAEAIAAAVGGASS